jgi:uroporphyrinogen-III synthase
MSASPQWQLPQHRLFPAPASRQQEFSAVPLLRRISSRIAKAARLDSVLKDVVEFVTSIVHCDSCFVYVLQNQELVLRASKNPHPEVVDRLRLKLGQGLTGWVAEHKEPVVISRGANADPRFKLFNELPEDRFESFLSVPLVSRGSVVGALNLQNCEPYDYRDSEIEMVSMIGFLVGAEIEMAWLDEHNLQLSERLESRTLVERAKGILQRDLGIGEAEAYQKLQRQSQHLRKPMKEIAEAIVLSHAIKEHK